MTDAMMNKATNWKPLVRQRRSQNVGVVYALPAEVLAVLDALMRTSVWPERRCKRGKHLGLSSRSVPWHEF
jgi:hypothetical protein